MSRGSLRRLLAALGAGAVVAVGGYGVGAAVGPVQPPGTDSPAHRMHAPGLETGQETGQEMGHDGH